MPSRCALTGCDKSACLQAMVPGASHWTYYCCGAHMSEAGAVQSETNRKQREASNRNRESTEEMKQRAVARGPVAVGGSPAPLPAAGAAQTSGSDEGNPKPPACGDEALEAKRRAVGAAEGGSPAKQRRVVPAAGAETQGGETGGGKDEAQPAGGSGTAPPQSAAGPEADTKPARKVRGPYKNGPYICHHKRRRQECKECNGKNICEHQRIRNFCKDCGGKYICEHKRQRNKCKDCRDLCKHYRTKSSCKECGGTAGGGKEPSKPSAVAREGQGAARANGAAAGKSATAPDAGQGGLQLALGTVPQPPFGTGIYPASDGESGARGAGPSGGADGLPMPLPPLDR